MRYRLVVEYEPRAGLHGVYDRLLVRRGIERALRQTVANLDEKLAIYVGSGELEGSRGGGRLEPPGCTSRDDAADNHGHEHDHERRAEQILIEDAGPRADGHRGERRCSLRDREAEHQPHLDRPEAREPTTDVGRSRLAHEHDRQRGSGDNQNVWLGELPRIEQHSRGEEEERDQKHSAHELDAVHQLAAGRNEAIQRQAREERADDPFQAHAVGHERSRSQTRQQEQVPRDTTCSETGQRPAADARQYKRAVGDEHRQPQDELDDDNPGSGVALCGADHEGEDEEGERVGDHGATRRHSDGSVAR